MYKIIPGKKKSSMLNISPNVNIPFPIVAQGIPTMFPTPINAHTQPTIFTKVLILLSFLIANGQCEIVHICPHSFLNSVYHILCLDIGMLPLRVFHHPLFDIESVVLFENFAGYTM